MLDSFSVFSKRKLQDSELMNDGSKAEVIFAEISFDYPKSFAIKSLGLVDIWRN